MKLFIHTVLVSLLAFSISCSSGGGSSDGTVPANNNTKTDNSAFVNVAGSIKGQWKNNDGLNLFVSDNRLKIEVQCPDGKPIQIEGEIKLTASTIKFLESKTVNGTGDCRLEFKKDEVAQYVVDGDSLMVEVDGEQMAFTRIQSGNTPEESNNGGTRVNFSLEFYTGANCTGQKMIYTAKMNCGQLAGGNISSVKEVGKPQCQNFNSVQDSRAICNQINQQLQQEQ